MTRSEIIQQLGAYAYTAAIAGQQTTSIPIELVKEVIKKLAEVEEDERTDR